MIKKNFFPFFTKTSNEITFYFRPSFVTHRQQGTTSVDLLDFLLILRYWSKEANLELLKEIKLNQVG